MYISDKFLFLCLFVLAFVGNPKAVIALTLGLGGLFVLFCCVSVLVYLILHQEILDSFLANNPTIETCLNVFIIALFILSLPFIYKSIYESYRAARNREETGMERFINSLNPWYVLFLPLLFLAICLVCFVCIFIIT